jgi:hypothetical protein
MKVVNFTDICIFRAYNSPGAACDLRENSEAFVFKHHGFLCTESLVSGNIRVKFAEMNFSVI